MKSGDNQKLVVTLSGGLDSVTLLYFVRDKGYTPLALSVDYCQRHRKELKAAHAICGSLGVEFFRADLRNLYPLLTGSSQTDERVEVPEGHYAEETMKLTVVPNRNMILLAVAGAWAVSQKAWGIAYAAHAGDHAIYPDCRPEFMRAMDSALALADWHSLHLYAPFRDKFKADIVREGHRLGVPFEQTWSCYKGGDIHCGRCSTCFERREAFMLAGVEDPTEYEDKTPIRALIHEFYSRVGSPAKDDTAKTQWICGNCGAANAAQLDTCAQCGYKQGYTAPGEYKGGSC